MIVVHYLLTVKRIFIILYYSLFAIASIDVCLYFQDLFPPPGNFLQNIFSLNRLNVCNPFETILEDITKCWPQE
jgi:hypothetical protein